MPSGGKREGAGRKPNPKSKTRRFAGQRWQPEKVERWEQYMETHNLNIKQFEEMAFELLLEHPPLK